MSTHKKKHTQGLSNKELMIKGENQEYATIQLPHGDCRFTCLLLNGNTLKAKLKGKMTKVRIEKNDFVLIQKDDSTTEKDIYYIVNKYEASEKAKLQKLGELKTRSNTTGPAIIMAGETIVENNDDEINIDDI